MEISVVYFFYPETQGRTLEELAFCKSSRSSSHESLFCYLYRVGSDVLIFIVTVFEDKALADVAINAVEATVVNGEDPTKLELSELVGTTHVERITEVTKTG